MTAQQTQIQIPERRDDEPPATAEQLQLIRQLASGRSLQGYRFDYRKLGIEQAATVLQQLQAMTDQPNTPAKPRKQGPGCIASLAKGTTALVVCAVVLAGIALGGYLIYDHIQKNPQPTASNDNSTNDTPDAPESPADRPNTRDNNGSTGSKIFEGLGTSDTPSNPTPDTPDRTTDLPEPTPEPPLPPAPTVDRDLVNQLAGLEKMLVQLSQFTRDDFALNIRNQSSQAMLNKLADYPRALAALDADDPTLSARIQAAIDAFAADQVDGPALRDDIKAIRTAIDRLQ